MGWFKNMLRSWLNIQNLNGRQFYIQNMMDFDANVFKNYMWYRGDPEELHQFFQQVGSEDASFWATATRGVRKIHTGIPALIADVLSDIVIQDMNEVTATTRQVDVDYICNKNDIENLLSNSLPYVLVKGDGAFKISFDLKVGDYPIIEFYEADKVEFKYERSKYSETIFKNYIEHDNRHYVHKEIYGYGYIKNELYTLDDNKKVPMNTVPELADVKDFIFAGAEVDKQGIISKYGTLNMAVPFLIFKSAKFKYRGKSIFETKQGNFDALDEVVSQWIDAIRKGRTTRYIPERLLPRNPKTGETLMKNDFESSYIQTKGDISEGGNKIQVETPNIQAEQYLQTYVTVLDLCLQGLISPSTLGIDNKKLDNAEAQREKEKATLYTRGKIVEALLKVIPKLLNVSIKAMDVYHMKSITEDDIEISIAFGEYANPSFESVVETMAKARQGQSMSTEKIVDEMYGDSLTAEEKEEEVKRIKEEYGLVQMDEPGMFNSDVPDPTLEENV
ncbi:hypothetical protein A4S06_05325 [Erysipelotrichaceae bacterium MTC7]|nr:hypothetical protein A4S06_05325 [Erysipelotrichaceae bacterium MTC7]